MLQAVSMLDTVLANPGWAMLAAGLVLLAIRSPGLRGAVTMLVPSLALGSLAVTPIDAEPVRATLMGLELILFQIDPLSRIFGIAFLIAAVLNGIYGLGQTDRVQDASGLIYAGAAVAAVFCGDFLTLFILFEVMAISSVWLIFARRTPAAYASGMRYLAFQILSGLLLLAGAALRASQTGSLAMPVFGPGAAASPLDVGSVGDLLIFAAFGIKAAFPLLHNWLQDSYPNATHTGTVVLSAFTTKIAVYALARCFPGTEALIWIGATMTVFPVFFAVIENDLRKVLAYSLNNQVGFMVCAIGVGGAMALNGAALHAFVHIIYKALLFMCMGAVMLRTGSTKVTEVGGLNRTMPLTTIFCIVGAASISAFPLFSGYVAKAFTMSAVGAAHLTVVWLMLLFASAGVLEHSGIKIPYCAFFGPDRGLRPREAPPNMLLAMGLAAALSILAGCQPAWLYALAPYPAEAMAYLDKELWTPEHVVTQMQLLVFAALAFALLKRFHLYPPETRAVVLDSDWLLRKPGHGLAVWVGNVAAAASAAALRRMEGWLSGLVNMTRRGVAEPPGGAAFWTLASLGAGLALTLAVSR